MPLPPSRLASQASLLTLRNVFTSVHICVPMKLKSLQTPVGRTSVFGRSVCGHLRNIQIFQKRDSIERIKFILFLEILYSYFDNITTVAPGTTLGPAAEWHVGDTADLLCGVSPSSLLLCVIMQIFQSSSK